MTGTVANKSVAVMFVNVYIVVLRERAKSLQLGADLYSFVKALAE